MHWLWALLQFKQPPARVLDVGCAHGGLVALARWAGYDATGLEMSPWVVELARRTFAVPMLQGPVERQQLPERSFDAIVLNDVLEHLADPAGTVGHCARLLKDDGVLLIQTPCYPEGTSHQELRDRKDRFLEMMDGMARQHLYLFSRRAVGRLLAGLRFEAVEFLPALFVYDMYLVAARRAVVRADREALAAVLATSPAGRMTLAWLDFLEVSEVREADRAARLDLILRLDGTLRQSEAARQALQAEVDRLRGAANQAVVLPAAESLRPGWLRSLRRLLRAG
jgi:SAM-dependent methyltransferase